MDNASWTVSVHRLALVLGYKKESGLEVFRLRTDSETDPGSPALHYEFAKYRHTLILRGISLVSYFLAPGW